jgi:hypothetical protein
MLLRRMLTLATAFVVGSAGLALADGHSRKAAHRRHVVAAHVAVQPAPPESRFGARLVTHPAWNIACNTRDRATRALPCDQPVWVYGSPCEIDLGLGSYRPCE